MMAWKCANENQFKIWKTEWKIKVGRIVWVQLEPDLRCQTWVTLSSSTSSPKSRTGPRSSKPPVNSASEWLQKIEEDILTQSAIV